MKTDFDFTMLSPKEEFVLGHIALSYPHKWFPWSKKTTQGVIRRLTKKLVLLGRSNPSRMTLVAYDEGVINFVDGKWVYEGSDIKEFGAKVKADRLSSPRRVGREIKKCVRPIPEWRWMSGRLER